MSSTYAELERFYEDLVTRARSHGIVCAITSGMACVAFGVAQTTQDCDLLCAPGSTARLLELLSETTFNDQLPSYRGKMTPPLDARWLRGGWTSHFVWDKSGSKAFLDVFGTAPRASSSWETEIQGFYAGPHTVAEMKRTARAKDWPFVTALGARMLAAGDTRGWLHIYDEELLHAFGEVAPAPNGLLKRRPILQLAKDSRLRSALHAEVQFWHELDRVRLSIYEKAVRGYRTAVQKTRLPAGTPLSIQHEVRVRCAARHLPVDPVKDYGVDRMMAEARAALGQIVHPAALAWLPDVGEHFKFSSE